MEAFGWRGIQVAYGRANSMLDESAAKNVLQMINQKRVAELQKGRRCQKSFHHLWRRLATKVKLTFDNGAVQGFWLMSQ